MLAEVRGAGRPGVSRWRRGLCLSKQFAKRRSLKNARVPPPLSPVYLSVLQRPAALSSCRRVRGPAVGMWVGWAWAMRRAGRGREGREAGSAAVRAHTTPLSISLYLAALCPAATARPPLARRGLGRRGHLLGDQEAAGDGRRHCAERERGGENDPRKNALVGRESFCFFNLVRLSSQATARRRLRFLSRTRRFTHPTHRSHTHTHTHTHTRKKHYAKKHNTKPK